MSNISIKISQAIGFEKNISEMVKNLQFGANIAHSEESKPAILDPTVAHVQRKIVFIFALCRMYLRLLDQGINMDQGIGTHIDDVIFSYAFEKTLYNRTTLVMALLFLLHACSCDQCCSSCVVNTINYNFRQLAC